MRSPQLVGLMVSTLAALAVMGAHTGSPEWRTMVVKQYGRVPEELQSDARMARPLVALSEVLKRNPQAVAVGALAGLEGEITVLDGKVWVARPSGAGLLVQGPMTTTKERAAFLIVGNVEAWDEIPIDEPLAGAKLERFIPGRCRQRGHDPDHPFPVVIEGTFTELELRVVQGVPATTAGLPADAPQVWRHRITAPQRATVIAFYAPYSGGNVTHSGTALHAHALVDVNGNMVAGHVERLAVAPGAVLRIPAWKK